MASDSEVNERQSRDSEVIHESIVEIVSDSGEGAQSAGQILGTVSARMGNGVWTVEIIPAEIEPPYRSKAGASGNRVRIGTGAVTNVGDTADTVIAFNEQVLYSRIDVGALREGTRIFLESKWAQDSRDDIRAEFEEALADFDRRGYQVRLVPMEEKCLQIIDNPRRGKNMWALGLVCALYNRDLELVYQEVTRKFIRKGKAVVDQNCDLVRAGYEWCQDNVQFSQSILPEHSERARVVMNGNQAIAMGAMAAGIEVCSMYPITPATSASHYLANTFRKVGGFVHQAEDEIAAIGFAIGASYAGKTALTITSGPGLALKTEFIGLAVMAEVPLVIVNVQRGGPSTGLPTRIEQSDLLAALFASPGDAPKIIMAASTIEECFHFMVTARKLAETLRTPVIVLTDANLATGVQPFDRPVLSRSLLASPIDQSAWDPDVKPYAWDAETGISYRPIPGQKDGEYVLTGLSHDENGKIAYESKINQRAATMRSRKIDTLRKSLNPPKIGGHPEGEMLVVGWGSTRGAIEEAVELANAEGAKISYCHLRFLSPFEPGLKEIFERFRKVICVEINYSDSVDEGFDEEGRRYSQLAMLLRSHTLCDIDCWSRVPGIPLTPGLLKEVLLEKYHAS